MIATLLFAAACLAPGLPWALVLRRRTGDGDVRWGEAAVEGLVLGLAWWLVLGLVVATFGDLGWVVLLVPTAVVAGAGLALARPLPRRRPAFTWLHPATGLVLAFALVLRRDPFYMLYQTSDMGEYIRAGNALAEGGGFSGWFVRLFQVPIALSSFAFGPDDAVAVVPFLGLLVAVVAASLASRLTRPVVGLAVLALLAVDPVAVWFSRFPASETLYAALLLGMLLFLFLAVQRGRLPEAVVAGGLAGLLLLTRGNALILAPLVLVALPLCALLLPPRPYRVVTVFGLAATAALYAGFVYDSVTQKAYFVGDQLVAFVPARLFPYVDSLDRPVEATVWAVVVAVAALAWAAGGLVLNRTLGPQSGRRLPLRPWLLPAVAVLIAAALLVLPTGVLVDSLSRLGVVLLVLALAGTVVAVESAGRLAPAARVVVVLCVLIAGAFAAFQADRLGVARQAPYHLYWDRYLFSEVVPALVVLGAFAVDAGRRLLARVPAPAVAVVLAVVGVAGGAQALAAGAPAREHELFDGAYGQLDALEELMPDPSLPVVYSGLPTPELPDGWFPEFTANTYRVVATPLEETFDRPVLNRLPAPSSEDPVLGEAAVNALLAEAGVDRAYLVQVVRPGAPELGTPVGTVTLRIPVLDRQPDPDDERWRIFELPVEVREVSLPV